MMIMVIHEKKSCNIEFQMNPSRVCDPTKTFNFKQIVSKVTQSMWTTQTICRGITRSGCIALNFLLNLELYDLLIPKWYSHREFF